MGAQHTQKPLLWEEGTDEIVADWAGRRVVIARVVAPAWHEDSNCAAVEAGANAQLFASAFDLHVALLDMLNAADAKREIWTRELSEDKRDRLLSSNDAHQRHAEARARAAIAKAEGR